MKKIKDLIYDYNDIFIAVMILALAAMVIMWRVSGIMDYASYINGAHQQVGTDVDFSDVDLNQTEVDNYNENPEDFNSDGSAKPEQQPADQPSQEGEGQTPAPEGESQQTPQTSADKTIVIPAGSSGIKIAEILVQSGLIDSNQQFLDAVVAKQAEKKLKAGTFNIPAGSTIDQIVDIIIK